MIEDDLFCLIRIKECRPDLYPSFTDGMGSIEELLEKVKNINYQDGDGDTFLHAAVKAGLQDVVDLLLKKQDIDIDISNKEGKTPLDVARNLKKQDILQMLESHIQQSQQISTGGQSVGQQQPGQKRKVDSDNDMCEKPRTSSSGQTSDADEPSTSLENPNAEQTQGIGQIHN